MKLTPTDILDSCPVFTHVRNPSRQKLIDMAQIRRFSKGDILFRQDDPCPGVYIVGTGFVRIYKLAPSGKEHVLHLAAPGFLFLEVACILQMPCPAYAQAIESSTCLLLPAAPFSRTLREDHPLCLQFLAGMAQRVHHFVNLLEDIVLRDALARVAKYLLTAAADQGPTINFPSLKKHLASHLNLTSETLSRCLRQLQNDRLIESTPAQSLRILDLPALKDLAEGLYPTL